jgi:hypothetical protein
MMRDVLTSTWAKFAAIAGGLALIIGFWGNIEWIKNRILPSSAPASIKIKTVRARISEEKLTDAEPGSHYYMIFIDAELYKRGGEWVTCSPDAPGLRGSRPTSHYRAPEWEFDAEDNQTQWFNYESGPWSWPGTDPPKSLRFRVVCHTASRELEPIDWWTVSVTKKCGYLECPGDLVTDIERAKSRK